MGGSRVWCNAVIYFSNKQNETNKKMKCDISTPRPFCSCLSVPLHGVVPCLCDRSLKTGSAVFPTLPSVFQVWFDVHTFQKHNGAQDLYIPVTMSSVSPTPTPLDDRRYRLLSFGGRAGSTCNRGGCQFNPGSSWPRVEVSLNETPSP